MALLYQKIAPSIVKIESKEFTARQLKKRMGENILQVIVDYEKVYGMTSVVDGVGIWINNDIRVLDFLDWVEIIGNLTQKTLVSQLPVLQMFNFSILYCYVYTVQFGIHEKKARGWIKVMVDFTKNLFYNL